MRGVWGVVSNRNSNGTLTSTRPLIPDLKHLALRFPWGVSQDHDEQLKHLPVHEEQGVEQPAYCFGKRRHRALRLERDVQHGNAAFRVPVVLRGDDGTPSLAVTYPLLVLTVRG